MGNTEDNFGDDFEAWVIQTRRAQGLPDRIKDPTVLAQVAELLRADSEAGNDHHQRNIVPEQRRTPEGFFRTGQRS